MKKFLFILFSLLLLSGCSISDSNENFVPSETENSISVAIAQTDSDCESEKEVIIDINQTETISVSNRAETETEETESIPQVSNVADETAKQEEKPNEPLSSQSSDDNNSTVNTKSFETTARSSMTTPETILPQTESSCKTPESIQNDPESTMQEQKENEPPFDINYWVQFAKDYAQSIGLVLNPEATSCWDNPIGAGAHCIYLERDIKDCLNCYKRDEDITDVWIWSVPTGDNCYDLMIGYA